MREVFRCNEYYPVGRYTPLSVVKNYGLVREGDRRMIGGLLS
mgnify:CR=1 FL=1